jgi:hypothetical protein
MGAEASPMASVTIVALPRGPCQPKTARSATFAAVRPSNKQAESGEFCTGK